MSFDVDHYRDALATRWVGQAVRHFPSLDSTNAFLKRQAREQPDPPEHGLVVVAEAQTAGYGQRGREWVSAPERGLYFSLWLPWSLTLRPVTLLAGVATVSAVREVMQTEAIALKWVNDLVCQGRKLGGILAEAIGNPNEPGRPHGIVLGIGVNLAAQEVADAIGLSELGAAPRRDALLAAILNYLELGLDRLETEGDRPLCDRWKAMAVTLGQDVRVETPAGVVEGYAADITDTGALVLRLRDGSVRAIASGTVRLADGRYC